MRSHPILLAAGLLAIACGGDNATPHEPDTTPPAVAIFVTAPTITDVGATVRLVASPSDAVGVVKVEFYGRRVGDGQGPTKLGEVVRSPYELEYFTAGVTLADNGDYRFHAKAYDAAGNVGSSDEQQVTVAIDGTAPIVTLAGPSRMTSPGRLRFTVEGNEGMPHVELFDGDVKVAEVTGTFIPQFLTVDVGPTDNGVHAYRAKGFDGYGNAGFSEPLEVTIDIRWDWALRFDGGVGALAPDGSGGIYLAAGVQGIGATSSLDILTAQYASDGSEIWRRVFGDVNSETPRSLIRSPDGAVYVGAEKYIYGGTPNPECLVLKYDGSGTLLWARQVGTEVTEQGCTLAVDAAGAVYLAGQTLGAFPGYTNAGGGDVFLHKMSADGDPVWTRQVGSTPGPRTFGNDYVNGIAIDPAGGVYVVGYSDASFEGIPIVGANDIFLLKYDAAGTRLWSRQLGTVAEDEALGIGPDPLGGVYVAGWNRGGLDGRPETGNTDILLARFGSDGSLLWVRQPETFGYQGYEYGWSVRASADRVYLVGQSDSDLGGGPLQGGDDLALLVFDRAGTLLDARSLGTPALDQGIAVAPGADGDVFVGGYIGGTGGVARGLSGLPQALRRR